MFRFRVRFKSSLSILGITWDARAFAIYLAAPNPRHPKLLLEFAGVAELRGGLVGELVEGALDLAHPLRPLVGVGLRHWWIRSASPSGTSGLISAPA